MATVRSGARWEMALELVKTGAFREFFRWGCKRIGNRIRHKCFVCNKSFAYYCPNTTHASDGLHRTRFKVCKSCCTCPDGHTSRPPAERKAPQPTAPPPTKPSDNNNDAPSTSGISGKGSVDWPKLKVMKCRPEASDLEPKTGKAEEEEKNKADSCVSQEKGGKHSEIETMMSFFAKWVHLFDE
ncbi:hypothetical protein Ddc_05005 [Ditylenchus destructor]|nr:hypothetical protein Ddc_05005 [Ditylenchus destructor]